jgi:creatinine amidohydrolase
MASGILAEMTLDEVRALAPEVVVLGVGSTEPHGPALPYGTDFFYCDELCRRAVRRANERDARVLMYPTLAIGNNVNFKAWPFACRIGVRTLMRVLLDIIAALEENGIRKVVLVNGHGGNTDTMRATLREHFDTADPERRAFVCMTSGSSHWPEAREVIEHPSDHSGERETARMMWLHPDLVHTEKLRELPFGKPLIEFRYDGPIYYVRPWHLHVPMAGGGETRKATPEKGRLDIETSTQRLAEFLAELSALPWHRNFPYPPEAE